MKSIVFFIFHTLRWISQNAMDLFAIFLLLFIFALFIASVAFLIDKIKNLCHRIKARKCEYNCSADNQKEPVKALSYTERLQIKKYYYENIVFMKIICALFLFFLFSYFFTSDALLNYFGIYDLYLQDNGVYCYAVTISNDMESYTVPAEIIIRNSDSKYNPSYCIEKAILPSGKKIYFEENDLEIEESVSVHVEEGDWWSCTLHNVHTVSSSIDEYSFYDFDVLVLILIIPTSFILWFVYHIYKKFIFIIF